MARKLKIVEQYQDYVPPFRVNGTVELLMRHVPAEYLKGLHYIVMTNSVSLFSSTKGKFESEGRRFRAGEANGCYSGGNIYLVMDRVLGRYPEALLLVPIFKAMAISEILYHEVGHHIQKLEQPGYRENEEAVADEWRDELLAGFLKRRYWYLVPAIRAYKRFIHPRFVRSSPA